MSDDKNEFALDEALDKTPPHLRGKPKKEPGPPIFERSIIRSGEKTESGETIGGLPKNDPKSLVDIDKVGDKVEAKVEKNDEGGKSSDGNEEIKKGPVVRSKKLGRPRRERAEGEVTPKDRYLSPSRTAKDFAATPNLLNLDQIARGLSDRKLYTVSRLTGISYPTLQNLAACEANPKYDTLAIVSKYLIMSGHLESKARLAGGITPQHLNMVGIDPKKADPSLIKKRGVKKRGRPPKANVAKKKGEQLAKEAAALEALQDKVPFDDSKDFGDNHGIRDEYEGCDEDYDDDYDEQGTVADGGGMGDSWHGEDYFDDL